MRQTFMANESNIERKWYVIDAEGQTLGRLSSEVASILRGKNKVINTTRLLVKRFYQRKMLPSSLC